jgi:DNA-binding response OmpR family regulator
MKGAELAGRWIVAPDTIRPKVILRTRDRENRRWEVWMALDRASDRRGGSGTILVIDDEDAVRDIARLVLEHAGFDVHDAAHGQAGLERARELGTQLRAVVLDMSMPRMGGLEVLAGLRNDGCTAPVVIMSGFSSQHLPGDVEWGQIGFLPKPFTANQLIAAVRAVVEGTGGNAAPAPGPS